MGMLFLSTMVLQIPEKQNVKLFKRYDYYNFMPGNNIMHIIRTTHGVSERGLPYFIMPNDLIKEDQDHL